MLDGQLIEPGGGFARHDLVMAGLAADHAPERNAGPMASRAADKAVGERQAERQRDLERARYRDPLIFDLVAAQLINGAAGELIGDVLVEAGFDDENRIGAFAGHGAGSSPRCPATFRP